MESKEKHDLMMMTMMTTLRPQGVCTGWPSSLLCTRRRPNLTLFTTQHSATEAFKHLSTITDLILHREELFFLWRPVTFNVDRIVVCEEKLYILLTSASFLMLRPSPSQAYLVVGRSVHCQASLRQKNTRRWKFCGLGGVWCTTLSLHNNLLLHTLTVET